MKFNTTRFGEIEFPEDVVMTFHEGILGFPQEKRYILLEHEAEGSPFKWLQSLENPNLAFIIVDPLFLEQRYSFEIDVDTAKLIGTNSSDGCAVMAIVNVPQDSPIRMTANLKAPLIVNVENRAGRQVIMGSSAYNMNSPIFPELVKTTEIPDVTEPAKTAPIPGATEPALR